MHTLITKCIIGIDHAIWRQTHSVEGLWSPSDNFTSCAHNTSNPGQVHTRAIAQGVDMIQLRSIATQSHDCIHDLVGSDTVEGNPVYCINAR